MKRFIVIALAIVCGVVFSESFAQRRKRAYNPEKAKSLLDMEMEGASIKNSADFFSAPPCMEESFDTMEESKGFGIGEGDTEMQARENATREALRQIEYKMPRNITSITTEDKTGINTVTEVESLTKEQWDYIYANQQNVCLKYEQLENGKYRAYITISVRKQTYNEEERAQLEKSKTEQEKASSDSIQQPVEEKVKFPCQDAIQNDDDYYYAWGKGKSKDQGMAAESAIRRAQNELVRQIGEEIVELNGVEQVCRMIQHDENGSFIAYVAIRMSKNK